MAEPEVPAPALSPDPILFELYGSERPPVELLPGISLSPVVNSCWLPADAKVMLSESWIPVPQEEVEGSGPPPPSFNAAAPEYNELVRRLSRSTPFQQWNKLTIQAKELEKEISTLKGAEAEVGRNRSGGGGGGSGMGDELVTGATAAKNAELEVLRVAIADAEAVVSELKASFTDDPLSLVSWMQALTDLADGGLTTFEVSGAGWPYCSLRSLFGELPSAAPPAGFFDGVERVLGTFKRRYEKERGPNRIQLLLKLAPNVFADAWAAGGAAGAAAAVEAFVERARSNVFGAEGGTDAEGAVLPLDLVQLVWWDFKNSDPLPVLKTLQKLATDQLEVNEETGEVVISEPKKIRGIGLIDFPADQLKAVIQAGVPITCVQVLGLERLEAVEHSVLVRSSSPVLALCARYGIKVLARGGTLGGLLSDKYLGAPPPDPVKGDPDLDSVPACMDMVNNIGGWSKLQEALAVVKNVAEKHGVKPETVALRWQIDAGCFPLATTRWGPRAWRQFGYLGWGSQEMSGGKPGVDAALFQVESFLDVDDMTRLEALATVHA
ncbi:radial spoke protein 5 [Volvox carteri f. nagariensis]|uniref:Radial spoke protein 5 n=1 Tax=Volvox carteri f. nagariensis TaxID=3068 RepID=D8U4U1_VOLCA|nr:radial spoke protein 5 [Volvox carteri f. nagariensis]EFJ45335.1 radial spoke protein 5 [Volvox carteri f. nagariensis]|eukprot:XP_002953711.1 radial spoke protein 5 [Volvox carteri f. nagariensis]